MTSYTLVESGPKTGGDFHAVHGIQLKNGDLISAGSGGQKGEKINVGTGRFAVVTVRGKWTAQLGEINRTSEANWVAESPDGSYVVAVGFIENEAGKPDQAVWKLDANTGKQIWMM